MRNIILLFSFFSLFTIRLYSQEIESKLEFTEIWAYLMSGEETFLNSSYPVSDIGYFGAGINSFGKLVGIPNIKNISSFKGRKHLVVAEIGNHALTHFTLTPSYQIRKNIIQEIIKASGTFDGVQIDFEAVSGKDRDHYFKFLSTLKRGLGKKILSVALPARTSKVNDAYEYGQISAIVDKIVIMAYDEHWSTSNPGSIASLNWCKNVVNYSISKIDSKKLIMGIPFYGRAWSSKNPAKAYKHSGITKLIQEKQISEIKRENEIPYFEYQETVNVTLYYEDVISILSRMKLYNSISVKNIAFWRLGQEDPEIWKYIQIGNVK